MVKLVPGAVEDQPVMPDERYKVFQAPPTFDESAGAPRLDTWELPGVKEPRVSDSEPNCPGVKFIFPLPVVNESPVIVNPEESTLNFP